MSRYPIETVQGDMQLLQQIIGAGQGGLLQLLADLLAGIQQLSGLPGQPGKFAAQLQAQLFVFPAQPGKFTQRPLGIGGVVASTLPACACRSLKR